MKMVLIILVAMLPVAALAAGPKLSKAAPKAVNSARQSNGNSLGSKAAQGVGTTVKRNEGGRGN